jgi:hypothetical protein
LQRDLRGTHFDFGLSDRADGVVDHDRDQSTHPEGGASEFSLLFELGRDDGRGRNAELLKGDGIPDAT